MDCKVREDPGEAHRKEKRQETQNVNSQKEGVVNSIQLPPRSIKAKDLKCLLSRSKEDMMTLVSAT